MANQIYSKRWLMRIADYKFRLNPVCHPVPIADTNFANLDPEFRYTEMFWELEVDENSYDKASQTLTATIVNFFAVYDEQRFKYQSLLEEVNHIHFKMPDWRRLLSVLKPAPSNILAELKRVVPPEETTFSRYGFSRFKNRY